MPTAKPSSQRRAAATPGGPGVGPATALGTLPAVLRSELLSAVSDIEVNYRQGRWGPSELDGGKLCEVVVTILGGFVSGSYPARAHKPANMVAACQALAGAPGAPRSVTIQIPRMLVALYEVRNNRGVGHVGGDVDPNHMDATVVVAMEKWVVAELVRVFHNVDTASAAAVVDALVEREVTAIWRVGSRTRVLRQGLTWRNKMLLVLYASDSPITEADLVSDVEHPKAGYFRRDVLRPAHAARLIEWDRATGLVHLSPLGIHYVESNLPLVV